MDFNVKKPTHLLALLLISITFLLTIVLPILSFLGIYPSTTSTTHPKEIPGSFKFLFEFIVIFFQLVIVFVLLILFPILWYIIVNKMSIREIILRLKLTSENIHFSIIFGFVLAVLIFIVGLIAVIVIASLFKVERGDIGNISYLESLFSPLSLFILVAVQPIAEEMFFRGFLLDKLEYICGNSVAILSSAILFGLSHATYGKIYTVIIAILTGILLAYAVIKTKNLFTSIIAHICFNVGSLAIYFLGKQFLV